MCELINYILKAFFSVCKNKVNVVVVVDRNNQVTMFILHLLLLIVLSFFI